MANLKIFMDVWTQNTLQVRHIWNR